MKAACWHGPWNLSTEEVERPKIGHTDILVKVKACGICGSDLHFYKLGLIPEVALDVPQGQIPGHEFGGEVVEVGAKVEGIVVGDRVVGLTTGAMAEYVAIRPAIPNMTVYRLPSEVSYEEAATVEPLATSLHAARQGNPADGETIVVFGAGIIGLGVIQCLKALQINPRKLIVVDMSEKRLEIAKKLGADEVFNAGSGDHLDRIEKTVGTAPLTFKPFATTPAVDLAYDCVGHILNCAAMPVFEQAMTIVREGGRIAVVGAFEGPITVNLMPIMEKEIKISGSLAYKPADIQDAIEFIRLKKVTRKSLVSRMFPLDQAKEAFEAQLKTSEVIKVLITP